jgi:hypothetical protein
MLPVHVSGCQGTIKTGPQAACVLQVETGSREHRLQIGEPIGWRAGVKFNTCSSELMAGQIDRQSPRTNFSSCIGRC